MRHPFRVPVFLLTILCGLVLLGCTAADVPSPTATAAVASASASATTIAQATATMPPPPTATATVEPTVTTTRMPAPTLPPPTVTATPDPFAQWTIESLRQRSYGGGSITVGDLLYQDEQIERYAIRYPSDGLSISGILTRPRGEGPFPVLLLNHGYYDPARYVSGDGTWRAANTFASQGYLTIASDYRNYAGSDRGPNEFRMGYVVDVMNLLYDLPTLPEGWAETARVGLWGHSMGGGVSINVVALAGTRVDGAVLYGAMSGDMADATRHVMAMWGRSDFGEPFDQLGGPDAQPDGYARMSAINYLDPSQAALSIHHGTADEQVPYPWSEKLYERALSAGQEVEFFAYPDTLHNFTGDAWSLFMTRCLDFYARTLGGD
ncbi:MAG: alpha/beta fold hydrolase [Anaerolineales bacterium]|nr:alpha/beta fold hydrolase [Anaerolineales bacterium]MCB9126403.1 alpha/beta fold hydrolase [Ardenticatenales bacterium]MCB9171564.1 alpha/beta fold hydrolase [Ardenticatenales bacterium]